MLLLSHVLIALTSIVFSGLTTIMPSHNKLRASYGLMVATLASGTWLVVDTHSPLLSACVTGLIYLGMTLGALLLAHRRLASAE